MSKNKKLAVALSVMGAGFISVYNIVAYAYTVPGVTEPYNPIEYYSLTEISFEDSPSVFAMKDLARNGGTVYDLTRHIKSIVTGDNLEKTAEIFVSETENAEKNAKSFSEEIFMETQNALKIIGVGTEKVSQSADISEGNPYLRQGNADDWETYDNNLYNQEDKYKWLDETYRNFLKGARQEILETEKTIESAEKILRHTNLAEGELQMYQARNELKTLLDYELARENALETNLSQLQAVYQAAEYDETVESAYIDLITKFDVVDPYDEVTYKMLLEEYDYEKAKPIGMPDFKNLWR